MNFFGSHYSYGFCPTGSCSQCAQIMCPRIMQQQCAQHQVCNSMPPLQGWPPPSPPLQGPPTPQLTQALLHIIWMQILLRVRPMIEVWPAKLITRFSQRFLAWLQEHVSIRHFVDPAACGAVVSGAVVGGAIVGGASARARSVTSRAGSACCCSWFEWTPAYPSCAAPSEARSVGASVEVGASADLRHMHNATVKRPAFRRIWAGVGETWGGRRVLL